MAAIDIGFSFFGTVSPAMARAKTATAGGTPGPDVTMGVLTTMAEIDRLFGRPRLPNPVANAAFSKLYTPEMADRGWDVGPLNELAHLGRPDFGNGSRLGTGLGRETVQFESSGSLHVYYAGSVNYFLWGLMFRELWENMRNPLSGAHDLEFSEAFAVAAARIHKAAIGDVFNAYAKEAAAFVRFGWSGTDPSSTALPLTPNQSNVGASGRFPWKWLGLHDQVQ
jgi:hypothetical protein